ncbi:hypothetical protein TNCV_191471 [Trichonephila clavipes]|nr:hypothetical protein TNCV_191471 [Trichonephila clavipes]
MRKLDCSGIEPGRDFSDESRFNLSSDDNRVRVWRPRGEHLNPTFALQRHTAPRADSLTRLFNSRIWKESGAHFHSSYVTEIDKFGGKRILVRDGIILDSCYTTIRAVSEEILATAASILCLKSGRSTPTNKSHMVSYWVNVEVMRYKLFLEDLCSQSVGANCCTVIFKQSRTERGQSVCFRIRPCRTDDETDEDEDNKDNESSKGTSNTNVFSAVETAMEWNEQQSECCLLNYCCSRENQRPCSENTNVYNGTAKNDYFRQ